MEFRTADLELFKEKDGAYIKFIEDLTSTLTEADEAYDGIRVSKRTSGYTIVIIKHGETEVPLVYRIRDLYIIGVIVGKVCYMDHKAYGRLSSCVKYLNDGKDCTATVEIKHKPTLGHLKEYSTPQAIKINKDTLKALLGVANSYSFEKFKVSLPRIKRESLNVPLPLYQQQLILSNHQENLLEYDGVTQQSSAAAANNVMPNLDMTGVLQLLTLGILHFTKKRLHLTEFETVIHNSREAAAVATDLTDRIVRFMICSGAFSEQIEYENQMQLQRQLTTALFRGDKIDGILSNFVAEYGIDDIDGQSTEATLYQAILDGECFE